jgi:hypothetical protein
LGKAAVDVTRTAMPGITGVEFSFLENTRRKLAKFAFRRSRVGRQIVRVHRQLCLPGGQL